MAGQDSFASLMGERRGAHESDVTAVVTCGLVEAWLDPFADDFAVAVVLAGDEVEPVRLIDAAVEEARFTRRPRVVWKAEPCEELSFVDLGTLRELLPWPTAPVQVEVAGREQRFAPDGYRAESGVAVLLLKPSR